MKIVYHHRAQSDSPRIHIREIVRAFQNLGHEVEVVSLVRRQRGVLWKKAIRMIPFAYEVAQLGYNLIGIPMLLARALGTNADFLYERYALFNFAGVLTAKLCRIPIMLEVNSPLALEQIHDKGIRGIRFAAWCESLICNMATRVIVVSKPLARLMESSGVAPARIEVIPNGVSLEDFRPDAIIPDFRQRLGIPLRQRLGLSDHFVIGFAGRFGAWNGLELLLEAFLRSNLSRKRVKVLLIGDGPAMKDLRRFVKQHKLADSVLFTGPLPHADVPRYLDLLDVAVQPAANEYCCPMTILEYMALGKPVVAPAQENIQELLSEEEAVFFTPGDVQSLSTALQMMADNREQSREMGRKAKAAIRTRGFLWSVNARRIVAMATCPSPNC